MGALPRAAGLTRTLLIDADIVAYQASAGNERRYDWGDGVTSHVADLAAAKRQATDEIDNLMEKLKADACIICLSDDVNNFRKKVDPTYKTNRAATVRPTNLYVIKDWLHEVYTTATTPWFEADDVMGILSTEPHEGERIIVSQDKDMQTIPGLLFNPGKDSKVRTITPEAAQRFMLWQAITGDTTDGYSGCPGAGAKAAGEVLDGLTWLLVSRTLKSGPRKGEAVSEWKLCDGQETSVWERIVSLYEKFGLTEAHAAVQVNLARILKHSDVSGNDVIPWVPAHLI